MKPQKSTGYLQLVTNIIYPCNITEHLIRRGCRRQHGNVKKSTRSDSFSPLDSISRKLHRRTFYSSVDFSLFRNPRHYGYGSLGWIILLCFLQQLSVASVFMDGKKQVSPTLKSRYFSKIMNNPPQYTCSCPTDSSLL